jgi:hypothetical protein
MNKTYNLKNIRTLLTKGFDDLALRHLCFDVPDFRPVYEQLAEGTGKARIVDLIMQHAEQKLLFEILLAWAEGKNPARYELHRPYVTVPGDAGVAARETLPTINTPPDQPLPGQAPEQNQTFRDHVLGWLGRAWWEGIGAIVAIIALVLTIAIWKWPDGPFQSNHSSCELEITELHVTKTNLIPNETTQATVTVRDCGSSLTYVWRADNGDVVPSSLTAYSTVTYTAPSFVGTDTIRVSAQDTDERTVSGQATIRVVQDATNP